MIILPIKGKWFDMMLTEDETLRKLEEYRRLSDYWGKRFATALGFFGEDAVGALNQYIRKKGITESFMVAYRNGYSRLSPLAEAKVALTIGPGQEKWGAFPDVEYYVQKIIEIRRII